MEYSKDLLEQIEQYASEMMSPSEICFLLDLNEILLVDDINTIGHPARKAFYRGLVSTIHEQRKSMQELATAGSPYSITECQKQIMKMIAETKV